MKNQKKILLILYVLFFITLETTLSYSSSQITDEEGQFIRNCYNRAQTISSLRTKYIKEEIDLFVKNNYIDKLLQLKQKLDTEDKEQNKLIDNIEDTEKTINGLLEEYGLTKVEKDNEERSIEETKQEENKQDFAVGIILIIIVITFIFYAFYFIKKQNSKKVLNVKKENKNSNDDNKKYIPEIQNNKKKDIFMEEIKKRYK